MKANSLGSLRVRLVLLVFLAMVPSLALILYTARVQRSIARGAARENLFRIASLGASDTSQVMEGAQQLLGGLAQSEEIRSGDSAACGTMMAKLLAIYPFYSTLGVASPEGKVICSAVPLTNSVSVADRSWFRQVRQTRSFTMGEYQVDHPSGKASITFAHPIEEAGHLQSVVFAALNLKYLNSRIGRVQLSDGVSLVVVDRQGTVLASSSTAEVPGSPAREASLLKSVMAQRGRGTEEVTDNDGVRRVYAYYPIGAKRGAEAYVSVSIPATIALAEANEELSHNLLGLTVVSLLALAAAWFGGHAVVLHKANDELEQRVQERTKELAHEQLLLRMLMDSMPDTIYFKDPQSRFTRVNRAQALVLGVESPDQAVGKTDADFFTAEHAQAALADERRILESGKGLISKTERIRRADGRFRWVTATKEPLRDAGGTVVGLAGISRDVTERMIAENLLRVLVDNLPDLVYIKDTQGHYVADNAAHRNFVGLRTVEQIVGKTAFDFYPKELAERIRADDQAVLESKIGVMSREEQFTNYRGEQTLVSTSKVPYRDEQGEIAGLVCISHIIGGRK